MNPGNVRIVFMGTPEFAVASLDALRQANFKIAGVVTAPDKPAGRGKKIRHSAVKEYALKNLPCPILQPEKLKNPEFISELRSLDASIFIIVAFRMLPEVVWSLPELGTVNLHASLLPQYRGAAPINWVIINGEKETGLTTFLIDQDIDTGKILLQEKTQINPGETAGSLHDRLMVMGADLVTKTAAGLVDGALKPVAQEEFTKGENKLKTAPRIHREDCRIDWSMDNKNIGQFINGLSPYPGSFSILESGSGEKYQVKFFAAETSDIQRDKDPGTIYSDGKTEMIVSAGIGSMQIKSLQLEGKKRMSIGDFLRGTRIDWEQARFIS